jgi:hypothetical protein
LKQPAFNRKPTDADGPWCPRGAAGRGLRDPLCEGPRLLFELFRRFQPFDRNDETQRLERPRRPRRRAREGEHDDGQRGKAEAAGHEGQYTAAEEEIAKLKNK